MEYVGGGDLDNLLEKYKKKNKLMSEKWIWVYLLQTLIGLRELHKLKIIHRDIKCANLFLSEDQKTIKIGDFNVAKITKDNLANT